MLQLIRAYFYYESSTPPPHAVSVKTFSIFANFHLNRPTKGNFTLIGAPIVPWVYAAATTTKDFFADFVALNFVMTQPESLTKQIFSFEL